MRIHFISIGGSIMHSLAIELKNEGHTITGSDDNIFEPALSILKKNGLLPSKIGWDESRININIDLIILGMHAKEDNPELKQAMQIGIEIMSFPQYIYNRSQNKTRIVIGGSHGKTTITSMIAHTAIFNKVKINFLLGEKIKPINQNINLHSKTDFIVLEGDEYYSSKLDQRPKFHIYKPNIALISGISWDHINVFDSFDKYLKQFEIFIQNISHGGCLIYNEEDEIVKELVLKNNDYIRKIPYSTYPHTIENNKLFLQTSYGKLPLKFFGSHNLSNLMGAKLICRQMGIQDEYFYDAISNYQLPSRRLELIENTNDRIVFKDFAHSPSKVKATTQTIRTQFKKRYFLACLELHTFSSLNINFINQYRNCLDDTDLSIIYINPKNIKSKNISNLTDDIVKKSFQNDNIKVFRDSDKLKEFLKSIDREHKNKVFIFMSSGNFDNIELNSIFFEYSKKNTTKHGL